jgi:hypothetical protein
MFQLRGNGNSDGEGEGVFSIKLNSSFRSLAESHDSLFIEFLTPGYLTLLSSFNIFEQRLELLRLGITSCLFHSAGKIAKSVTLKRMIASVS